MTIRNLRKHNLAGQKFGSWTVIERTISNVGGKVHWLCRCKCGVEKEIITGNLINNKSTQCKDCYQLIHGRHGTSEYNIWQGLKSRCQVPTDPAYPSYGGRGITVCERWMAFENFYEDMGNRPSKEYSLDRVDNNGPYSKDNCRWATRKQQARNRRTTLRVWFNGEEKPLKEWAEIFEINYHTLWSRIKNGWPTDKAITTKTRKITP